MESTNSIMGRDTKDRWTRVVNSMVMVSYTTRMERYVIQVAGRIMPSMDLESWIMKIPYTQNPSTTKALTSAIFSAGSTTKVSLMMTKKMASEHCTY